MRSPSISLGSFVLSLALAACSSSSSDATSSADADADADADTDTDGADSGSHDAPSCPPNDNPPECPSRYMEARMGGACAKAGVNCKWYGEGDLPCPSYAICSCEIPAGADAGADGGDADAGGAIWTHCAQ